MIDVSTILHAHGLTQPMVAILSGVAILGLLAIPWCFGWGSDASRVRQAMIDRHRDALRSESLRRTRQRPGDLVRPWATRLTTLIAMLPAHLRDDKEKLLNSAGFFGSTSVFLYWSSKIGCGVFFISAALFHFIFSGSMAESTNSSIFLIILLISFFVPDFILKRRRGSRLKILQRGLPDALDLLVICAEAGLSLDAALRRVADEFAGTIPELSEELLLTSVELNFLPARKQALVNLTQRVNLPSFRGVVNTLIQTEKYGTPLAAALRSLASEFRDHRLLAAEERAARLPAILTVPMIVFILPALFIVLAGPAAIQISQQLM